MVDLRHMQFLPAGACMNYRELTEAFYTTIRDLTMISGAKLQ
jgi:hypothetical protein